MQYSKILVAIGILSGSLFVTEQTLAGFDWKSDARASVQTMESQNAPVENVNMLPIIEPEIIEPEMPVQLTTLSAQEDLSQDVSSTKKTIEGFGRDVPLAYALSSIVPVGFGYAFGGGVNPALPITWKGGKPWDQVLEEAVHPHNLFVHMEDQKVSIQTAPPPPAVTRHKTPAVSRVIETPKSTIGREVLVRRVSGDVEIHDRKADIEADTEMKMISERPSETSMEDNMPQDMIVEESVEEEMIVEKINPDLPREIVLSSNMSDENIFELVVSERSATRVLDPKKITHFHAKAGQTVRNVLEKWSEEADVQLYWETPYDFPVERSIALVATYPMAVQALLGRYETHDPKPTVKLHPNWPHGPSILTVK